MGKVRKPLLGKKLNIRTVIGKKNRGKLCGLSEGYFLDALQQGDLFRVKAKINGLYRTVYVKGVIEKVTGSNPKIIIFSRGGHGYVAAVDPKEKRLYNGKFYFDKIKKKQVLVLFPTRKADWRQAIRIRREIARAKRHTIKELKKQRKESRKSLE